LPPLGAAGCDELPATGVLGVASLTGAVSPVVALPLSLAQAALSKSKLSIRSFC
jgi:predicted house-cleaning NTP pyrophosphatase (Maf/HAM1 superfamily)